MPRIFISYRRADSKAISGRIHDHLMDAFGRENVFMDVDDIPPGVDFRTHLQNEIDKADIVLIIIGSKWASILRKRRNNPQDFVRIELETALEKQKVTIPVLVEGGMMPTQHDVPERVKTVFPYLNAVAVGDNPDFRHDMDRLIEKLKQPNLLQLIPTPLPQPVHLEKKARHFPITPTVIVLVLVGIIISAALISRLGGNSGNSPPTTELPNQTPTTDLPTETFQSNEAVVTVKVPSANLRSGPGTSYSVIETAGMGQQFNVIAQNGNANDRWYLVNGDNGANAWVASQVVDINPEEALVDVAVTIPASSSGSGQTAPQSVSADFPVTCGGSVTKTFPVTSKECYFSTNSEQAKTISLYMDPSADSQCGLSIRVFREGSPDTNYIYEGVYNTSTWNSGVTIPSGNHVIEVAYLWASSDVYGSNTCPETRNFSVRIE
ncbi:MAG: TIR domain-containing protein [Anaerolineae bacterium]|nr:TIR domain-containing protein [Anaerolineae bacterium]